VNVINIYDGAPNLTTPQRYLGLGVFSAERTDMRSLKSGDLFTVENCIPVRVVQIFTRSIASSITNSSNRITTNRHFLLSHLRFIQQLDVIQLYHE
jgi:hypothetical protein